MLDHYFDDIRVEAVRPDEGWGRIAALPRLFPGLDRPSTSPGDVRP